MIKIKPFVARTLSESVLFCFPDKKFWSLMVRLSHSLILSVSLRACNSCFVQRPMHSDMLRNIMRYILRFIYYIVSKCSLSVWVFSPPFNSHPYTFMVHFSLGFCSLLIFCHAIQSMHSPRCLTPLKLAVVHIWQKTIRSVDDRPSLYVLVRSFVCLHISLPIMFIRFYFWIFGRITIKFYVYLFSIFLHFMLLMKRANLTR